MNKSEFVNEIYNQVGLTKKDCKLCLEVMLDVIKTALQNGECVSFSNFGKFKVNDTKTKSMYSFKTKTLEVVESKRTPIFKASENLKQSIK